MASEDQSAARSTGKVNWFNDSKGYGFITPDGGGEELFVHQSSIVSEGYRSLAVDDLVEFSVAEGSDGKTKAVDVTAPGGAPLKKKESSSRGARRGGGCYNCGEAGHLAKDCRDDGRERRGASSGGCYTCGEDGHFARDCVLKASDGGDERGSSGGGGGACYTCGGVGHIARDCATKRQSGSCYECGGYGHLARDCERRGSGGGGGRNAGGGVGNCYKCGEGGHFARECSFA